MKILIDQIADLNVEHIRSMQELRKEHEIAYWIRIEDVVPLDKSAFPGTIFHNYMDAAQNIPPKEIDTSGFEPWGRDEIVALSAWESELMTMMDKGYSQWPTDKRKEFYYELLKYWGGVLDTIAPDIVIFNAMPHQVFNFVLYAIARERGIRTLIFDITFSQYRLITCEDYREGNKLLAAAKADGYGAAPVSLEDLPQYLQDHYNRVSGTQDPTPDYLVEFKRTTTAFSNLMRRARSLVPYIRDGSIFELATRRFFKLFKPRLSDVYNRLAREPDLEKPYVYLALHYQPECTTSPQGGIYVDQLLMVKTLAAALPVGWELYVKEHPAQWPTHWGDFTPQRYEGFYESIASVPNVRIMPIGMSTFVLCDHAKATATATGTAAWESILRGKPGIVFGYPSFMHAPGIFRVASVADCRAVFEKIQLGYVPDKGQLMKYLKILSTMVFPGTLSISADELHDADREEQWKGMYHALHEALKG